MAGDEREGVIEGMLREGADLFPDLCAWVRAGEVAKQAPPPSDEEVSQFLTKVHEAARACEECPDSEPDSRVLRLAEALMPLARDAICGTSHDDDSLTSHVGISSAPQPDSETLRAASKAFKERAVAEGKAIEEFLKKPAAVQIVAIKDLEYYVDEMQRASGDRFLAMDERFHLCLARYGGVMDEVHDAFKVIYRYNHLVVRTENSRRAVCDEHQDIVQALKDGDGERAARALNDHLSHARSRLFPRYAKQIADINRSYFDRMGAGDCLIFSSPNIDPVEMALQRQHWESVGKAAAAAVGRGATLLYLRPSEALLKYWRDEGINELVLSSEIDMQTEFEAFQWRITSELSAQSPVAAGSEQISDVVRRRVIQLYLDDESLFLLTRPNRTLGYFHYRDGQDVLTERLPMGDEAAWDIIDSIEKTHLLDSQFFLCTARTVLKRLMSTLPETEYIEQIEMCMGFRE